MLCCSLVGAAALTRWRQARAFAPLGLAALALVGALHAQHYVERARANERTLLAEVLAAPICAGRP